MFSKMPVWARWFIISVLVILVLHCAASIDPGLYLLVSPVLMLGEAFLFRSRLMNCQNEKALETTRLREEIDQLRTDRIAELERKHLCSWLGKRKEHIWEINTPEVEMETKFVFPLLRSMGYRDTDMSMRVTVSMQKGRAELRGEADWVVYDDEGNALVVLEAKAPRVALDGSAVEQARSYAIQLEAPVYVVTNGEEIQVFQRGAIRDRCVFTCATRNLEDEWQSIEALASKTKVVAFREELLGEGPLDAQDAAQT